jgi:uncharacterized protein (DUF1330 family)
MSAYFILTFDVTNADRFAEYNPGSLPSIVPTIAKHGGEIVFAGPPEAIVGSAKQIAVGIKFPDADAAKAWLADDEYAPFKAIRMESTTNVAEYVVGGLG